LKENRSPHLPANARFSVGLEAFIDSKRGLSMLLVDWSATSDAIATARLGKIRDIVRNKAGYAGTDRNVIRDTDVLAALEIPDKEALLPCPDSLADIGTVVEREQLPDAVALIPTLSKPLLIHAAGGIGKTVFMQSLAKALEDRYEIVFFDCFGGGAYRSPEDSRHLPKRGLIHIANSLACRGLCDPILPDSDDLQTLLKTFRRRLEQCVITLLRVSPKKELLILLDAIDNAAEHARDRHEEPFPIRLLESVQHAPVPGLTLVASSRSHRVPIKHIPYQNFELRPFSPKETASYLRARMPNVTDIELRVAQARSDGNPRILEYLVTSGRGLLDSSEIDNKIELTDLIQERLDRGLLEAMKRGYKAEDTDAFLAGLAVLPPPVPLEEYAEAQGMPLPAIESFVSDLWPLLERTKHGLMFRDEPTETLVREKYASKSELLRRVASNLLARQDRSVYAARALPGLLQKLGDGEQLFKLAFDERFPAAITSTVGKRNIRYARLKAAVHYAANRQDYNELVHLLLELSTIAAVDRRGADYILDFPDLVIAARDIDATRRLFEIHTTWQGTRHARLTIAHTLSGDLDEASRHALRTRDWLRHYRQQYHDDQIRREGPEHLDVAAIPFFLNAQGRNGDAVRSMWGWKDWYAYEVGEYLFGLIQQRQATAGAAAAISSFLGVLTKEIGCLAAAVSFVELNRPQQKKLIKTLSRACRKATKLEMSDDFRRRENYRLQDGLRKASAVAVSLGIRADAAAIAKHDPHQRPNTWSFNDYFSDRYVFPFLFHVALTAALKGKDVQEKDIIPTELVPICKGMKAEISGTEFKKELTERLEKALRANREEAESDKRIISYV
jgi:NACHT domain